MPSIPRIPGISIFREKEPTYISDPQTSAEGDINNDRGNDSNRSLSTYFWNVFILIEDQAKASATSLKNRVCYSYLIFPIAKRIYYIIHGTELEKPERTPPLYSKNTSPVNTKATVDVSERSPIEISPPLPPVHLPWASNSCWASAFWQVLMAMPKERWLLHSLAENDNIDDKLDPKHRFRNIGCQVKTYSEYQEKKKHRLPVTFTNNVREIFLDLMDFDKMNTGQHDPLELLDPFFDGLRKLAEVNREALAGFFVCTLHDLIQVKGGEPLEMEEDLRRTYGAQFGSLAMSDERINPENAKGSLETWFESFFSSHTRDEGEAFRKFEEAPHMFIVRVERTEKKLESVVDGVSNTQESDADDVQKNAKRYVLNEEIFKTPKEVVFEKDKQYQNGEERSFYQRAGFIVYKGTMGMQTKEKEIQHEELKETSTDTNGKPETKQKKNPVFINQGHYWTYIEQSDGKIYRCDDLHQTKVVEVISEKALREYREERDKHAVLFLYSRVDSE